VERQCFFQRQKKQECPKSALNDNAFAAVGNAMREQLHAANISPGCGDWRDFIFSGA
jgi:hypothetical protein